VKYNFFSIFSDCDRVSDYGFSKLIELFEAIPTTVEITEDADGERLLQLTDPERLAVLGDQVTISIGKQLIRSTLKIPHLSIAA
jgi:hypothetical protein